MTAVVFGTTVNFTMFLVSFLRRCRIGSGNGSRKDEIIRLTLNRAMRLEFILFLCQITRVIFIFENPDYSELVVVERIAATFLLIVVSIWDLSDRNKIATRLDDYYQ